MSTPTLMLTVFMDSSNPWINLSGRTCSTLLLSEMSISENVSKIIEGDYRDKVAAIESIKKMAQQNQRVLIENLDILKNLFDSLFAKTPLPWNIILRCTTSLISYPYSVNTFNTPDYLAFLIDISRRVTLSFLKLSKPTDQLPDMRPFVSYISKNITISFDVIVNLAKHCEIGFIHKASFLHCFFPKLDSICTIISKCDKIHYSTFIVPITNPDRQIQLFFMLIWIKVIPMLSNSFFAIQILKSYANSLIYLLEDPYTATAAQYLLEITKSSPNVFPDLLEHGKRLLPQLITTLTSQNNVAEPQQQVDVLQTKQRAAVIQRAKAQIYTKKAFSSTWEPFFVTLIVQARVMMWGKNENQTKYGEAIGFSEITGVELTDSKIKGNKNVLVIKAKKEYSIAFESQNIASQWANVLQSQKPR